MSDHPDLERLLNLVHHATHPSSEEASWTALVSALNTLLAEKDEARRVAEMQRDGRYDSYRERNVFKALMGLEDFRNACPLPWEAKP